MKALAERVAVLEVASEKSVLRGGHSDAVLIEHRRLVMACVDILRSPGLVDGESFEKLRAIRERHIELYGIAYDSQRVARESSAKVLDA